MYSRSRDLTEVLLGLYESEINFSISCFWDGGINVRLGDEMNGFKSEATFYPEQYPERVKLGLSASHMADWLHARAIEHFPNSRYAQKAAR